MTRSLLSLFLILILIPGSLVAELRLVCMDDVLPPMAVSECCCIQQTGGQSCDISRLSSCCCERQIVLMQNDGGTVFSIQRLPSYPDGTQNGVLLMVVDADLLYAVRPIQLLKFPSRIPRFSPSLFLFHSSFLI